MRTSPVFFAVVTTLIPLTAALTQPIGSFSRIPTSQPTPQPTFQLPQLNPPQQQQPSPTLSSPFDSIINPNPDNGNGILPSGQDLDPTSIGQLIEQLKLLTSLLLQPSLIRDINTVIRNFASLLADPLPAQIKGLINSVTDFLGTLGPFFKLVSGIDFAGISKSVSGLFDARFIDSQVALLKEISSVVTADFVRKVVAMVDDIAPLVSSMSQFMMALIVSLMNGMPGA